MNTCTIEYAKAAAEKAKIHIDNAVELRARLSVARARSCAENTATDRMTDYWFTRKACHEQEIDTLQDAFNAEIKNANAIIDEMAETEIG